MDIHHNQWTQQQKVTIISAYRVCLTTIKAAGPNTAFCQQWDMLEEKGEKKLQLEKK